MITPIIKNEGKTVICDRFADSTMAYQGYGYADKGLGPQVVQTLYDTVVGDFKPDLTIVLDGRPEELAQRRELRGVTDRYEQQGLAFQRRLRNGFLTLAKLEPERIRVLNAEGSRETVAEAVQKALLPLLQEAE